LPRARNLVAPPSYAEKAFPQCTVSHYAKCPWLGIRGHSAYVADAAASVLDPDWLETARLRPPRHAARV